MSIGGQRSWIVFLSSNAFPALIGMVHPSDPSSAAPLNETPSNEASHACQGHGHDHDHGHAHGLGHSHHHSLRGQSADYKRRLAITLVLAAAYMVAEIVGGLITNSLALLADAGHMFSDVASLALSFFAVWLASQPSPPHRTFGYHRAEILAALANGVTLVAVSIFICVEAYERVWSPPEVEGGLMMIIAVGGLVINLIGLWILNTGRAENLNIRGAWLHVLTDALGSVGAIAAGVLIWAFGWEWADPVASVLIALLVLYSAWSLVKESVGVLMESAPARIDVDEVRTSLMQVQGVIDVHDLHVWTITSGMDAISAHVVTEEGHGDPQLLRQLQNVLATDFQLLHATLQLEPPGFKQACDFRGGCPAGADRG